MDAHRKQTSFANLSELSQQEKHLSTSSISTDKQLDTADVDSTASYSVDSWGLDHADIEDNTDENSCQDRSLASANKSVRFHEVEIREYGVILGDHPATSTGPPITIEWEHQANHKFDLEDYEKFYDGQKRRKSQELRMPKQVRETLLLNHHSMSEIRKAQRDSHARRLRQNTSDGSPPDPLEEAWDSAVRKFKRWSKRKSGAAPDLAELWLQNYKQEQRKKKSGGMARCTSDMDFSARHQISPPTTTTSMKVSRSILKMDTIGKAMSSQPAAGMRKIQSEPLICHEE